MLRIIICAAVSYLLGCISPSIVISKAMGGDIREKGSGNAGTTNMLRTYGKKAAAATFLIDILKGCAAAFIGKTFLPGPYAGICVLAVICGHIWPALYGFRGGKGVATALGSIMTLEPKLCLIVFAAAACVIALTKMVSAGSVLAAVLLPILSFFIARSFFPYALLIGLTVLVKHRANIGRILNGTESKIHF